MTNITLTFKTIVKNFLITNHEILGCSLINKHYKNYFHSRQLCDKKFFAKKIENILSYLDQDFWKNKKNIFEINFRSKCSKII